MPGNWPTLPKHRLFTQEPQILHQNLGHVLALQPWTVICGRKCFAILVPGSRDHVALAEGAAQTIPNHLSNQIQILVKVKDLGRPNMGIDNYSRFIR